MLSEYSELNYEQPQKVILDIGSGPDPYYKKINANLEPGVKCISLDLSTRGLIRSQSIAKAAGITSEFIKANAQLIPLADSSIDEVWLSNIMSAPLEEYKPDRYQVIQHLGSIVTESVQRSQNDKTGSPAISAGPSSEQIEAALNLKTEKEKACYSIADNILTEALRVLKDEGKLNILETPDWGIRYPKVYEILINRLKADKGIKIVEEKIVITTKKQDKINALVFRVTKVKKEKA